MQAQEGRLYAQIVNSKVHWLFTQNELADWNNEICPAVDITESSPQPEIGWLYNTEQGTFSAPIIEPTSTPHVESIYMRQCQLQLLADGLLDEVEAAILNMDRAAQIEWKTATTVERSNPLVPAMQQLLGWDEDRVITFFYEASLL